MAKVLSGAGVGDVLFAHCDGVFANVEPITVSGGTGFVLLFDDGEMTVSSGETVVLTYEMVFGSTGD